MVELDFIKELLLVIGSVTAILATLGAFALWLIKMAFKRGELFSLFKSLVDKVASIESNLDKKFIKNDDKHEDHYKTFHHHDKRITKLEISSDVKSENAKT